MAKENINKILKDLKNKIQEGKVVIGTERVLKGLREKKLKEVFLANNYPQKAKDDINHYAKLTGISVIELSLDNEELGLFCKKSFFVSVLGTLGE